MLIRFLVSRLTRRIALLFACGVSLAACSTPLEEIHHDEPKATLPMSFPKEVVKRVHIGRPYSIKGKRYTPSYQPNYDEHGIASWYGPGFHGKKTANGETYNQYAMTAAHPTLPIPSLVRVTRQTTGESIVVRINDRGPFAKGRIIDLSKKAAQALGIKGIAKVRVEYLKRETESYWAKYNVSPKGVPKHLLYAGNQPAYEETVPPPQMLPRQAAAPIMSVNSMQVTDLKPLESTISQANAQPVGDAPNQFSSDTRPANREVVLSKWNKGAGYKPYKARNSWQVDEEPASVSKIHANNAAPANGYVIQAGAFSSLSNANRLVGRLAHVGKAFVDSAGGGSALHRVKLGPYETHEMASDYLHELFKLGIKDATVIASK